MTFGRTGDPLCHPEWKAILEAAREAGVGSIHVETDLHCEAAAIADLARLADVVSVHLPAVTAGRYAQVMGVDAYGRVTRNLATLMAIAGRRDRGLPLIVPTFVKTTANLDQMEPWYDGWLQQAASAVIRGPDAFDNLPPVGVAVAAMIRSERRPRELLADPDGRLWLGGQPLDSIHTLGTLPLAARLERSVPPVVARDKEAA